jgi:hypothetical protein
MVARTSSIRSDRIDYSLWLVFDEIGGVRMTRRQPSLERHERGMALTLTVPRSVFKTPQFRASIKVEDSGPGAAIDIVVAEAALKRALGIDIDLRPVTDTGE